MPTTKSVIWTVPQGATFVAEVLFVDPDTGAAIDLTGYSARLQARIDARDPDPPVYSTTSGGGGHLVITAASGLVTWTIPAAVTEVFDFNELVFDLEVESGSGAVHRLVKGRLVLDFNVTR